MKHTHIADIQLHYDTRHKYLINSFKEATQTRKQGNGSYSLCETSLSCRTNQQLQAKSQSKYYGATLRGLNVCTGHKILCWRKENQKREGSGRSVKCPAECCTRGENTRSQPSAGGKSRLLHCFAPPPQIILALGFG